MWKSFGDLLSHTICVSIKTCAIYMYILIVEDFSWQYLWIYVLYLWIWNFINVNKLCQHHKTITKVPVICFQWCFIPCFNSYKSFYTYMYHCRIQMRTKALSLWCLLKAPLLEPTAFVPLYITPETLCKHQLTHKINSKDV